MSTTSIILYTLGIATTIESLYFLLFTKSARKTLQQITKSIKRIKDIAWIELLLGLILLVVASML